MGDSQSRDPRFESLAGTYDEAAFRKTHAFLYDENLPNERKRLAAKLKVRARRGLCPLSVG